MGAAHDYNGFIPLAVAQISLDDSDGPSGLSARLRSAACYK
jgi:hypothetical protein